MAKGHTRTRQTGGARRGVGAWLAVLALTLQALLPLAAARWHAAQRDALAGAGPAQAQPAKSSPLKHPAHPATADGSCQLCIGLQMAGGPLPTDVGIPLAPIAYRARAAQPRAAQTPITHPAVVPPARAPPVQV